MMKQINIPATDFDQRSGLVFAAFKFTLLVRTKRPSEMIRYRSAKLAAAIQAEKQRCTGMCHRLVLS